MSVVLDIIEPLDDVSLWCIDETSKRLESSNFYSWSPVGKPTEIERNGCHKGLNIIGATEVLNHFTFLYDVYSKNEGSLAAVHVVKYLECLLDYDRKRGIYTTIIQWDNAPIHKGPAVQEFIASHKSDLIVLHQPPYSPQLNPQEEMWHWMKNFIAQASAVKNEQELLTLINRFDKYITARPDMVKHRVFARNYFP